MKPVLVYLNPLDQKTGARVDVRVADGPSADTYGVGGAPWQDALITRPTLSIELMSPDMDGRVQAGQARFDIAVTRLPNPLAAMRYYWRGASVVIHNTGTLEGASAVPDFWGYVTEARLDLETGRLSVSAEVSTALIDKPLLTKEFTGGNGLLGDPAKRGVLMPAGFGVVKNIPPVWFDLTRNIGMIDGYANTVSIDWLGEGLSSFGPRVANYATYDDLAAAIDNKTIKPGQWGTCVAQGLIGLGAPPTGTITVHATFGSNRIGAIMKRILLTNGEVDPARVDGAGFNALDALVPRAAHFWTDQQRNVKDLLEALAQSCNATPLVTFQNLVTVTRAIASAPVAILDRSGGFFPRVIDWKLAAVDPPFYVLKARAARPGVVLSDDQVNYVDTLVDQGIYSDIRIYRAGDLVYLTNGSQWLYQNAVPGAGHAPPANAQPDANGIVQNNFWIRRTPPKSVYDFDFTGELNADKTINQPVVQFLGASSGRAIDSRLLNSANVYGLRSLSSPPTFSSTYQSGSNTATVTIANDGQYYNDFGVNIALPSASFPGLAPNTKYYFWRNMPVTGPGNSYGYSTSLTDALGVNKAYLGFWTTPAAAGGSGGGGGYGGGDCVAADAWVPTMNRGVVRVRDIQVGDRLVALSHDMSGLTEAVCEAAALARNDGCRLVTASRARLTLAINTPVPLGNGDFIIAANAWGRRIALSDRGGLERAIIGNVIGVGEIDVVRLSCGNATFAASDDIDGPFLFTHNANVVKY